MPTRPTAKPSRKEPVPGHPRLYKRIGVRKVSYYYQYPNGESETLATAELGNRQELNEAERIAKRKHSDIVQGVILAGSVAEMIERFEDEEDPKYKDQSKDGIAVRKGTYRNLKKFFGKMHPRGLKTIHGYQYIDDRSKAGAPEKAWKELYTFSKICRTAIRWGVMEANPFTDMDKEPRDKEVRTITRHHVIRFYLWSQKQKEPNWKIMGCAAMFAYLTGFRPHEVRPFHASGLTPEGVKVINAKRKRGQPEVTKLREWSRKLRAVVQRTKQAYGRERLYLFANRHGSPYTRSGWGSVWQDAMLAYIGCDSKELVEHPLYFALQNNRHAAITRKLEKGDSDVYPFAAHTNQATTHRHYDRRKIKRATATE